MASTARRSRALLATLAAAAAAPLAAATGAWHEHEAAKVRWISRWAAVAPGDDAGLGLEFALAPGWHVYWKNPGDAGYAPAVELGAGPLDGAELRFPAPRRFPLAGGLETIGYEGEVVFPVAAAVGGVAGESFAVAATVDYLLCAESCVPYRHALELELPVAERSLVDPEVAPRLDAWLARLPRPLDAAAGERLTSRLARSADDGALEVELELAAPGAEAVTPDLFFDAAPEWIVERPLAGRRPGALAAYRVRLLPRDPTRPPSAAPLLVWTATGFTRAGLPLAWTGGLELAAPPGAGATSGLAPWLAPGIVGALVLVWLALRRRGVAASL